MDITIKGDPKEIAALVLELQKQQRLNIEEMAKYVVAKMVKDHERIYSWSCLNFSYSSIAQGGDAMHINLDKSLNEAIYSKILPLISGTLCHLTGEIKACHMSYEKSNEILERKANQLKRVVTDFIDSQAGVLKANIRSDILIQDRSDDLLNDEDGCSSHF